MAEIGGSEALRFGEYPKIKIKGISARAWHKWISTGSQSLLVAQHVGVYL